MRSVEAVDYALQAPRSEALTSVLSTLQPDQYRLVTQRADVPLIVQGHPGTGKTIIAIHRAGVSGEPGAAPRTIRGDERRVCSSWARLTSGCGTFPTSSRRSTSNAACRSKSYRRGFRSRGLQAPPLQASWMVRSRTLASSSRTCFDRSASLCKQEQPWATGPGARMKNLERLYEVMRVGRHGSIPLKLGKFPPTGSRLFPTFGTAIRRRRYLPLFAQASLSILGGPRARYDHVVVDEAQDVAGLEWEVIRAHNPASGWTLVGDMNQRRTDFGDSSWERLVERLSLAHDSRAGGAQRHRAWLPLDTADTGLRQAAAAARRTDCPVASAGRTDAEGHACDARSGSRPAWRSARPSVCSRRTQVAPLPSSASTRCSRLGEGTPLGGWRRSDQSETGERTTGCSPFARPKPPAAWSLTVLSWWSLGPSRGTSLESVRSTRV